MNIVLFGPPGAGKGTVAQRLSQDFSIPHISTGNIFRQQIRENTELGKQAKILIDNGRLVPDNITTEIVKNELSQDTTKHGFILDGYPRTNTQTRWLARHYAITHYFIFNISDETVIERLSGRRVHPKSGRTYHIKYNPPKTLGQDDITGENLVIRGDDTKESITLRLAIYYAQTRPVFRLLKKTAQCHVINADQSVDGLYKEVFAICSKNKT